VFAMFITANKVILESVNIILKGKTTILVDETLQKPIMDDQVEFF
jgi:hypothetical protein